MNERTGIPTPYKGITYRSRVEARWAAFFDQLGWTVAYEPIDADYYIPDFVIMGDDPVAVEVKADLTVAELDRYSTRVLAAMKDHWRHDVLIVGSTWEPTGANNFAYGVNIGMLYEWVPPDEAPEWPDGGWHNGTPALWHTCTECGITSFYSDTYSYRSRICGHHDGDHLLGAIDIADLRAKWAAASEAVKWMPDR